MKKIKNLIVLALISGLSAVILKQYYPAPPGLLSMFYGNSISLGSYLLVSLVHLVALVSWILLGWKIGNSAIRLKFPEWFDDYYYHIGDPFPTWMFIVLLVVAASILLSSIFFAIYLKIFVIAGIVILFFAFLNSNIGSGRYRRR